MPGLGILDLANRAAFAAAGGLSCSPATKTIVIQGLSHI